MTSQNAKAELLLQWHQKDASLLLPNAWETEKPLLPIIQGPKLSTIGKLQGFFETLDRLRSTRKTEVVKLVRVWYTDANALVCQKVDEAIR